MEDCHIIQHSVDGLGHQLHGLLSVIILNNCSKDNKIYKLEALSFIEKEFIFHHIRDVKKAKNYIIEIVKMFIRKNKYPGKRFEKKSYA